MAEYLNVVGNAGNTIVDDNFRCHHLIEKVVKTKPDTYDPAGMALFTSDMLLATDIIVSSIDKPIVAASDCSVFQANYTKISTNTWRITVFISKIATFGHGALPSNFSLTFYVFGLVENYQRVIGQPIIEVFNNNGGLVFSSALKYLKVLRYFNAYMPDVEPLFFDYYHQKSYSIPIPGFSTSKKYAVVVTNSAHSYFWFDGGGARGNYTSTYEFSGSNVVVSMYASGIGYLTNYLDSYVPTLGILIIDVTNY